MRLTDDNEGMGRIVNSADFSDRDLQTFLKRIDRLDYQVAPATPRWIQDEAESFSRRNPKPSPAHLRALIDAAVKSSTGWDDPDQADKMLHAALKSHYLLDWLDHLLLASEHHKTKVDALDLAKVVFTPAFRVE